VRWCAGALVRWCGGALVRWCGGALVRWCGGAVVRRCGGAAVRRCGGAAVRWCGGAVRSCLQPSSYEGGEQVGDVRNFGEEVENLEVDEQPARSRRRG
jgi:hypothetical protein